jgi:hypothetical protein
MEEIKQLVNEGKDTESQGTEKDFEGLDEDFDPDIDGADNFQSESVEEAEDNLNPEREMNNQPDNLEQSAEENFSPENEQEFNQQMPEEDQQLESQTDELDEEFEEMREELQNEISSIKDSQERHDKRRKHTEEIERKQEPQNMIESKNPAGTEDVNTGRDEEPLFLEVESFEDMKQMVEEMHYLTTEMDDVMNHLETGIEEDNETVTEAKEIVKEFQNRRGKIQNTLKNN